MAQRHPDPAAQPQSPPAAVGGDPALVIAQGGPAPTGTTAPGPRRAESPAGRSESPAGSRAEARDEPRPEARAPGAPGAPGAEADPPTTADRADLLRAHLQQQATEFLRALRQHRESGGGGAGSGEATAEAVRALRAATRRVGGAVHTFRPLLDTAWADALRPELAWLSTTLGREHAYAHRLERLLCALQRLSGTAPPRPADGTAGQFPGRPDGRGGDPRGDGATLTVGAAKAGALLERQLTLARTRAHSTALQALGSSRFHAVADTVAVLASEVPLARDAAPGAAALAPLVAEGEARLLDAVAALPLLRAGRPYNAEALTEGLAADPAPQQDAPWHHVRLLLRLHRYAREVLHGATGPTALRLRDAGRALDRHRDAAEAAAAVAAAARTPRIAPATAYALGVLHADQRHEVEAARFAFQSVWLREAVGVR